MRLVPFITAHIESILRDWVAFAETQFPAAHHLDLAALQDHARLIIEEVVNNMNRQESERERKTKSEGNSLQASTAATVPSRSHARQRERQGFEMGQMVAEYRALRATVLRLWQATPSRQYTADDLEDVIRFNEAIDQALTESVDVFVEEVDRARDVFLGIVGHDLRGPLSTIAGRATLELRKWPDDVRHAPVVLRSVAQMKALLDDLMEFTAYRLGKGPSLALKPMQLDQFARDTIEEIETVSSGRVVLKASVGNMAGEWDDNRLHQALSNLVFNALKYGAADSPVWVELDGTDADEVRVSVRNLGKAIAPDLLPRMFDPLIRKQAEEGDSQIAGANLGLGLFVVREIVQAHAGSITVTSDHDGTNFLVCLPRKGASAPPGTPPVKTPEDPLMAPVAAPAQAGLQERVNR